MERQNHKTLGLLYGKTSPYVKTSTLKTESPKDLLDRRNKHIVKVLGLRRGGRSDLTAIMYPRAKVGDVCLAGELRDIISAVAVPPNHSTRRYLKFWLF